MPPKQSSHNLTNHIKINIGNDDLKKVAKVKKKRKGVKKPRHTKHKELINQLQPVNLQNAQPTTHVFPTNPFRQWSNFNQPNNPFMPQAYNNQEIKRIGDLQRQGLLEYKTEHEKRKLLEDLKPDPEPIAPEKGVSPKKKVAEKPYISAEMMAQLLPAEYLPEAYRRKKDNSISTSKDGKPIYKGKREIEAIFKNHNLTLPTHTRDAPKEKGSVEEIPDDAPYSMYDNEDLRDKTNDRKSMFDSSDGDY